jgi:hypothetical protein
MAFADGSTDAKSSLAKQGWTAKSPEDMAKEAVAKWKSILKLSDDQVPQFESVMTDSYKKMAEAKTAAAGDRTKMKESMKSIMSDRDAALTKVLTADQMKIYHENVDKMMAKGKEHMSGMSKMNKPASTTTK